MLSWMLAYERKNLWRGFSSAPHDDGVCRHCPVPPSCIPEGKIGVARGGELVHSDYQFSLEGSTVQSPTITDTLPILIGIIISSCN